MWDHYAMILFLPLAWPATDRAWVVPIAAGLAVPFLWWNAFAVMVAGRAAVCLADPPASRRSPRPDAAPVTDPSRHSPADATPRCA